MDSVDRGKMCSVHTHVHACMHVCTHTHTSMTIQHIENHAFILITFHSNITGIISTFPFFIVLIIFSDSEKPVSIYSQNIIIITCLILEYTRHVSAKNKPATIIQYSFIFFFTLRI